MLSIKRYFSYLNILLPVLLGLLFVIHLTVDYDLREQIKSNNRKTIELNENYRHLNINELKFDFNETGFPFNIVPNIVHYVLFKIHEIEFGHFISVLSVLRNQRPEKIYIHCDCDQLTGDNYQRVLRVANKIKTQIIVRRVEKPTEIFGKTLRKKYLNWHASDITRIRVLQEFGGIYLDRDVYVVKSLDIFRKYELTIAWDDGRCIENSVIISHKNARFLMLWLDNYHDYRPESWYYNAGEFPTKSILPKRPELINRVKEIFATNGSKVGPILYSTYYKNWTLDFYTFHMLIRGDHNVWLTWLFEKNRPPITKYNDTIAAQLNTTFGEMTRILFDFEKQNSE